MSEWTEKETIRRRVSICGRVVDSHGNPMSGIQLTVTPNTKKSKSSSEGNVAGARRVEGKSRREIARIFKRTESRADGTFFFWTVPMGNILSRLQIQNPLHRPSR